MGAKLKFSDDGAKKDGTAGEAGPPDGEKTAKHEKHEKKISRLEKNHDKYGKKRDRARGRQPTKKTKVRGRCYDESKNKAKTKIRFAKEPVPMDEAKWNTAKKPSLPARGAAALATAGINKLHTKVYEAEHENAGTQAAHRAELVGESAYRGAKKLAHGAYRHARNAPYRKAAKYETKSIKARMELDYQKALKENPKMKSNTVSRHMQRHKIKRRYAETLRKAKKTGETAKKAGSAVAKAAQTITKAVRRNPIFLLQAGFLLLIVGAVFSMFGMCMSIFSGGAGVLGAAAYAAPDGDIDKAELSYTEWETDLRLEIQNTETTHVGHDEYRYSIGTIGHDPHELMAYLTAAYQDFAYADIENALREIFGAQYSLEHTPETETKTRTETRTGTRTDDVGNVEEYEYDEEVEYEWSVLNVTLTAVTLTEVILPLMESGQLEQYFILMQTKGARQYAGNPFTVNWLPHVTSHYGYRIHPETGAKDCHRGTDIGLPAGTPIRAGIGGTVTAAAYDGEYGNHIVVGDGNGLELKYAHCATLMYAEGQSVAKGDIIATVGNTGDSTGPHLHMEIVKDGTYLNPAYFVESN